MKNPFRRIFSSLVSRVTITNKLKKLYFQLVNLSTAGKNESDAKALRQKLTEQTLASYIKGFIKPIKITLRNRDPKTLDEAKSIALVEELDLAEDIARDNLINNLSLSKNISLQRNPNNNNFSRQRNAIPRDLNPRYNNSFNNNNREFHNTNIPQQQFDNRNHNNAQQNSFGNNNAPQQNFNRNCNNNIPQQNYNNINKNRNNYPTQNYNRRNGQYNNNQNGCYQISSNYRPPPQRNDPSNNNSNNNTIFHYNNASRPPVRNKNNEIIMSSYCGKQVHSTDVCYSRQNDDARQNSNPGNATPLTRETRAVQRIKRATENYDETPITDDQYETVFKSYQQ